MTDEDAVYLLHISDLTDIRKIDNPDSRVFAEDFQDTITQNGSKYVPLKFKDKFEFKGPANGMALENSFVRPLGKKIEINIMDSSSTMLIPGVDSAGLLLDSTITTTNPFDQDYANMMPLIYLKADDSSQYFFKIKAVSENSANEEIKAEYTVSAFVDVSTNKLKYAFNSAKLEPEP